MNGECILNSDRSVLNDEFTCALELVGSVEICAIASLETLTPMHIATTDTLQLHPRVSSQRVSSQRVSSVVFHPGKPAGMKPAVMTCTVTEPAGMKPVGMKPAGLKPAWDGTVACLSSGTCYLIFSIMGTFFKLL